MLRAYVTPHELIFINMGVSALSVDQHARQMSGAMGGGALPALIATAVAHRQREHFEKLSRALEKATPERLREYIAGDNSCLLLPLNEISDPRIEKSTFWSRLNGPHKALLRFRHVSRGETTLEVFERTDVGKAIAAFAKHFQDGFRIDLNYRDAL